jgi:membrane protein
MLRLARRALTLLRSTFVGWWNDDGALVSAATAYYAAFSLFPLCLVVIAVLGFVGRHSQYLQTEKTELIKHVAQNFDPWLAEEIARFLDGVQARAFLGGPLGLLLLVVAAIGVFTQLENIFGRIWDSPARADRGWLGAIRDALWDRLLAFLTLLAISALLLAVFLTDTVLAAVRPYLAEFPAAHTTWPAVQWLSMFGCNMLLMTAIYKLLPQARVPWRDALAGGLLAAAVWALGRYVLLTLVVGKQYSAYGVVGAMMGVMLWFYYASAVIFLGAEFVHAIGKSRVGQPPHGGVPNG